MTENGDMAPTIVVSPSYNYGNPTPNYADADPYCEALPQELVNDLMPVVESRYRTYSQSTDAAGLEASREHRAIGGFRWEPSQHGMHWSIRLIISNISCRSVPIAGHWEDLQE